MCWPFVVLRSKDLETFYKKYLGRLDFSSWLPKSVVEITGLLCFTWTPPCKTWLRVLDPSESVHCCSIAKPCPTLCDPMDCSMPGLPYPLPSPGVCPSSCPLNQWCHPTISSSVALFFCPQSFPASGSFPMSQLFTSGGQSIGASPSVSVLPMNSQDWFPLLFFSIYFFKKYKFIYFNWRLITFDWLDLLAVQGTLHECSPAPQFESILYGLALTSIHDFWKNHSLDYTDLCWQSNVSAFEYVL